MAQYLVLRPAAYGLLAAHGAECHSALLTGPDKLNDLDHFTKVFISPVR